MAIADDLKDLFSAPRGEVKLGGALVDAIVKYLLETVEVKEVNEVRMVDALAYAKDAWTDQKADDLPKLHESAMEAWIMGAWPKKSSVVSSAGAAASMPKESLGSSGKDLDDEDEALFGDANPTAREIKQLAEDKAAQGISGVRVIVLSASLELGRVPPASDVLGQLRYGSNPVLCKLVKDQRKAGMPTLSSIVAEKEFDRTMNSHVTGLIREYSARGQVEEASLITTWWSEVQAVASTPKMRAEYVKEYLKTHGGRGLPVPVDILIATRCTSGAGGAEGSSEVAKDAKDSAKAARAEVKELKSEMKAEISSLKNEVNRLRNLVRNQNDDDDSKPGKKAAKGVKCHNCGKRGHFARDCPDKAGEKKDAEDDEDE